MKFQNVSVISILTLACASGNRCLAQNFIQVSGSAVGTGDLTLTGAGGSTTASVSINNLFIPNYADERRTPLIVNAGGETHLGASGGMTNQQIAVTALSVTSAYSACSEGNCGEGHGSGGVTSRLTFQVDAPAVLYCQGVASSQLIAQSSYGPQGSANASATADLLLFGTGVGIQFHRQMSALSSDTSVGLSIPAGGVARLLPGIDYRLDVTASSNAAAAGDAAVALGYTSASGGFYLVPDSCPTSTDPVSITTCPSIPATFSVIPSGTAPFVFQWDVLDSGNWTSLSNGAAAGIGLIAGATTDVLHISDLSAGSHAFRCVVSNSCGSATSHFATLSVCPADFNCDSVVDFFDYLDFVSAFASGGPSADFNGDSIVDFFDYLDFVAEFGLGC